MLYPNEPEIPVDRRRKTRFQLRLPALLVKVGQKNVRSLGRTVNISSEGTLFRCRHPLHPGDIIQYIITLQNGRRDEPALRMKCKGRVVRVDAIVDEHGGQWWLAAATIDTWETFRVEKRKFGKAAEHEVNLDDDRPARAASNGS